jgi:hypothetical protein
MGVLIKRVTNGEKDAKTFLAVPLPVVLSVVFGLCSIIGAVVTWAASAANERGAILDIMRREMALLTEPLDKRLTIVEARQRINEDIIGKSSGWIEAQKAKQ